MSEINRKRKSDGLKSDVATSDSLKKSRRLQCDFCTRAFNKSGKNFETFVFLHLNLRFFFGTVHK